MIMMDSECSQLKAAIRLSQAFTADQIHLVKSNPSATHLEQILDLSWTFPMLHKGAAKMQNHSNVFDTRYEVNTIIPTLLRLYDVASISHIKKGALLAHSLTNSRILLQHALGNPLLVLEAYKRTGIEFGTKQLVNHETMITNFPGARTASAEMLKKVRAAVEPARAYIVANGFLTQEELIEKLKGPVVAHIEAELEGGATPREDRSIVNQRACIINHPGMVDHLRAQEEKREKEKEEKKEGDEKKAERRVERAEKKEKKEDAAQARTEAIEEALEKKQSPLAEGKVWSEKMYICARN